MSLVTSISIKAARMMFTICQWAKMIGVFILFTYQGVVMSDSTKETESVVESQECQFYPPKDIQDMMVQFYNNLDKDCLFQVDANSLAPTGIPVLTFDYETDRKDFPAIHAQLDDYEGDYYFSQYTHWRDANKITLIVVTPSKKIRDQGLGIFRQRKLAETLPPPTIEYMGRLYGTYFSLYGIRYDQTNEPFPDFLYWDLPSVNNPPYGRPPSAHGLFWRKGDKEKYMLLLLGSADQLRSVVLCIKNNR